MDTKPELHTNPWLIVTATLLLAAVLFVSVTSLLMY